MGKRDNLYTIEDMVEFDEGYFTVATSEGTVLKRGRGSQKKSTVAVMAESVPLEDLTTGKKSRHCRYFKMNVIPDHKAESVNQTIVQNLDDASIVF